MAGGEGKIFGTGFLWTWVVLISRSCVSRIFAISIVMPQKSGTRCTQAAWQVREHSEHFRAFFLPKGSI